MGGFVAAPENFRLDSLAITIYRTIFKRKGKRRAWTRNTEPRYVFLNTFG